MSVSNALREALRPHLSAISIESLMQRHLRAPSALVGQLPLDERQQLAERLAASVALFSRNDPKAIWADVRSALLLDEAHATTAPIGEAIEVPIRAEVDVSVARNEARRIATAAGGSATMAVKVATAVSELARNIVLYAARGSISLESGADGVPFVAVVARDAGPGIAKEKLEAMFAGSYRSKTGLGKGMAAVKRIATSFEIETAPGQGTVVRATFRGGT